MSPTHSSPFASPSPDQRLTQGHPYLYKLLADRGHTVSGWIRERRLEQCHRDLTGPALDTLPVGAVGGRWGFPDPARFSHAFKAAHGMSPGQARAAAQASRQ
ncbi:helix-turn-helix domain-containing protein [Streptomyces sp. HM190]|uniref:helix-turn-helix domain-containing protein n=1 Tax=Streptomyces sp. HM190 TaxID=2695266 RepID=UPI00135934A0|nr:helix-turn-helix domain-containing protein [Streptomyces sp. HM190]